MAKKTIQMTVDYQNYITCAPFEQEQLYTQACSNDKGTINHWIDTWINNLTENHKYIGSFAEHSIGKLWNEFSCKPVIIAGSGPSLKKNIDLLKERPSNMGLVSCLHNFHFMEDHGANVDYYTSLDGGPITITEVSEGGSRSPEEYWELTKNRTLLACTTSHPDLIKKWKGEILFFQAPIPDKRFQDKAEELEKFYLYVSTGGNVLGASCYIAKAFLGANPVIFIGADFSFDIESDKFHSWSSSYDKMGVGDTVKLYNLFGLPVKSWQSYANFKSWFDYVCQIPNMGLWINCTEGGCLGSYAHGNIMQIKQMDLSDCFKMYTLSDEVKAQCSDPTTPTNKLLF